MTIAEVFADLRDTSPSVRDGVVRRRLFAEGAIPLFAAVSIPGGKEFLFLEVDGEGLTGIGLPSLKGLDVSGRHHGEIGSGLVIAPRQGHYRDLFLVLAEGLVNRLRGVRTVSDALAMLVEELVRWSDFLEEAGPDGLSEIAQRGLVGELVVLRDLLREREPSAEQIGCWTGPLRRHHDLQLPGIACEVKALSGQGPHLVRIANESQLDSGGVPLLLWCVLVTPHLSGELSLPDLVASLRNGLRTPAAQRSFEDRLLRAGYHDAQTHLYSEQRYFIAGYRVYDVKPGFPRILPADLPSGVGGVSYSVALAACDAFLVEHRVALSRLREALDRV
jgi:hypothetical protein